MRPEILALRATNQYRSRDVIAYLGLRYYFANVCASRDRWAMEVATHLVRARTEAPYFKAKHFKDFIGDDVVLHRNIFIPGPNEAFAEAALLAQCAEHAAFTPLPCVFSYHLAMGGESQGVYVPYFDGFRRRHEKIREACTDNPNSVVFYTDIKKFYPSIPSYKALEAWNQACLDSHLLPQWRDLGLKLLADHLNVATKTQESRAVLTGPMFSHLIANLVMRTVDDHMVNLFPNRYFRYVDDVVLVGSNEQVATGRKKLTELLASLDLHLHDQDQEKDFVVPSVEWLEGAADLDNDYGKEWANFVGGLKQLIVTQPAARHSLADRFLAADFRIPLPSYDLDVRTAPWLIKLRARITRYPWLLKVIKRNDAERLIQNAHVLREQYGRALAALVELGTSSNRYTRKRAIPKLRFFAGRLLYIGSAEMLLQFSKSLGTIPELRMLSIILYSVATRDVTKLVPLGTNAVQSAAQVLAISALPVSCQIKNWTPECLQGVAILRFNGITVDAPSDDALNRLAVWGGKGPDLMGADSDASLLELACLHGVSASARHSETLTSVFDWDESLAFDVINQVQDSDY
ncbi:RNA-directed DNA polymerase [Massilia norwichensis]|uniref:RNA-directed DNA polymerase n=1 Tax=Massilia norwichensis TaxID=1442366 RepID=A0ABT2A8A2_9BURK|nr:RNA-directed DNA polymerase [Massilia norwichensis]MCS0590421.1 RNA-directed DNA polymerase [Massilia norwichensis]